MRGGNKQNITQTYRSPGCWIKVLHNVLSLDSLLPASDISCLELQQAGTTVFLSWMVGLGGHMDQRSEATKVRESSVTKGFWQSSYWFHPQTGTQWGVFRVGWQDSALEWVVVLMFWSIDDTIKRAVTPPINGAFDSLGRLSNFLGGSACLAFYHPCRSRTQDQWTVSDVLLLSSLKEKMQYKLYKWFEHTTFWSGDHGGQGLIFTLAGTSHCS